MKRYTSVHDLDLNSFKDQEKGTLKNGSIKLGKSTYTVKFIDGKVSVSRNFHFFNLFRANAKNELRDAFNAKMYDSLRSKNETLYTNTFNALEKIFKGDGSKSMMLFGMGDSYIARCQVLAKRYLKHPRCKFLPGIEIPNDSIRQACSNRSSISK